MSDSRIGGAYVDIRANTSRFHQEMATARSQTMALGSAFGGLAGKLAVGGAALGVALTAGIIKSIDLASELNETLSFTKVVFGAAATEITRSAELMERAFGLSKNKMIQSITDIGMSFKGLGASQADSAKLGTALTVLATDIKSAKKADLGEVLTAISASLRNEFDPLEKFGVKLSAAKVEATALAMGFKKSGGELSEVAKQAAAVSEIFRQTKDFQMDLLNTQDSVANRWDKVKGQVVALATAFGEKLLPAASAALTFISEILNSARDSFSGFGAAINGAVGGIVAGFTAAGMVVRNFGDYWQILRYKITAFIANLDIIPENLMRIGKWIGKNWLLMIGDAVEAVWKVFLNLSHNIQALGKAIVKWLSDPLSEFKPDFKGILEGFKPLTEAMPELLKPDTKLFESEINAVYDRIASRERDRQKAAADERKKLEQEIKAIGKPDLDFFKKLEKTKPEKKEFLQGGEDLRKKLQIAVWDDTKSIATQQLTKLGEIATSTKEVAKKLLAPRDVQVVI